MVNPLPAFCDNDETRDGKLRSGLHSRRQANYPTAGGLAGHEGSPPPLDQFPGRSQTCPPRLRAPLRVMTSSDSNQPFSNEPAKVCVRRGVVPVREIDESKVKSPLEITRNGSIPFAEARPVMLAVNAQFFVQQGEARAGQCLPQVQINVFTQRQRLVK